MRGARGQSLVLLWGERVAIGGHAVIPLLPGRVGLWPMVGLRVVARTGIFGDLRCEVVEFLHRLRRGFRGYSALIHVTGSLLLLRIGEGRELSNEHRANLRMSTS